jgi:hypothetical protein
MISAVFPTSTADERSALFPPFCSSPARQDGRTDGRTTRCVSRSFVRGWQPLGKIQHAGDFFFFK